MWCPSDRVIRRLPWHTIPRGGAVLWALPHIRRLTGPAVQGTLGARHAGHSRAHASPVEPLLRVLSQYPLAHTLYTTRHSLHQGLGETAAVGEQHIPNQPAVAIMAFHHHGYCLVKNEFAGELPCCGAEGLALLGRVNAVEPHCDGFSLPQDVECIPTSYSDNLAAELLRQGLLLDTERFLRGNPGACPCEKGPV